MSPNGENRAGKFVPSNNLYTVILALSCGIVLATAAFVAFKCLVQYGTFFKIP